MVGRRTDEEHRVASPLELLFDLCFVVAVAFVSAAVHQGLVAGTVGATVLSFATTFFAIWWAWMNFTWFASAYDTDDVAYRLTTFVQIAGALVLAAGVPRAFSRGDFAVITFGYVIMRLALVSQWLRVSRSDARRHATALRFAVGVSAVQVGWVARLALPHSLALLSFVVLAAAELAVPVVAERAENTPWHPHHIAERYGLFTLIVLGESVAAATIAIEAALAAGHGSAGLYTLATAGLVIVFSMWWVYFDPPVQGHPAPGTGFVWGYGHYFIFAAAAAVGAALSVAADAQAGHARLATTAVGYVVAVPVAVYVLGVWALHGFAARPTHRAEAHGGHDNRRAALASPVAAVLVLLAPLGPAPVQVIASIMAALVAVAVLMVHRGQTR
jgi:low temperature requirement protein LtrA